MTCYEIVIKNKSHQEVRNIIEQVIDKKKTPEWAIKELNISKSQFNEVYNDIVKHMIVIEQ